MFESSDITQIWGYTGRLFHLDLRFLICKHVLIWKQCNCQLNTVKWNTVWKAPGECLAHNNNKWWLLLLFIILNWFFFRKQDVLFLCLNFKAILEIVTPTVTPIVTPIVTPYFLKGRCHLFICSFTNLEWFSRRSVIMMNSSALQNILKECRRSTFFTHGIYL